MPNILRIPSPVNNGSTPQLYDIETDTAATGLKLSNIYQAITKLNTTAYKAQLGTNISSAFNGCRSLTTLDLSDWNTTGATNMSYIFTQCVSLTNIDLTGWNTSSATIMSQMFDSCQALTAIDVTNWDVSHVTSFRRTFFNCASLTELDLTGWNTSSATDFTTMFNYSSNLHKIWVPSTFVATAATGMYTKPFDHSTVNPNKTHIYTDATDAETQGWGTINADYIVHYNSTHADYENA